MLQPPTPTLTVGAEVGVECEEGAERRKRDRAAAAYRRLLAVFVLLFALSFGLGDE